MAWIILEGLDRTGKSTVTEHYAEKGYIVHHMSAPDKKYTQPGYVGPSYFEELVDLYMKYDGQDVVFDRSPYGELIWPKVYNREPHLSEDDFEFLRDYEDNNDIIRILMHDDDNKEAHWKRCTDNKEPLNRGQFNAAIEFFKSMADTYGFIKKTLPQIKRDFAIERQNNPPQKQKTQSVDEQVSEQTETEEIITNSDVRQASNKGAGLVLNGTPERKLEIANAIKKVLSKQIVKQKGELYERIENDLRNFLTDRLDELFGTNNTSENLDELDIQILKRYCETVKKKMEEKQ